jgi:hypothetical protein
MAINFEPCLVSERPQMDVIMQVRLTESETLTSLISIYQWLPSS